jgi:DNA-binding XRE family transcriptional regulator
MIEEGGRVFRVVRERRTLLRLAPGIKRRKPRDYLEWRALRELKKLPYWEESPPGYLLKEARENAGLTQADFAARLGITQQAVSQAERWDANPTIAFMRRWAEGCGVELEIRLEAR